MKDYVIFVEGTNALLPAGRTKLGSRKILRTISSDAFSDASTRVLKLRWIVSLLSCQS